MILVLVRLQSSTDATHLKQRHQPAYPGTMHDDSAPPLKEKQMRKNLNNKTSINSKSIICIRLDNKSFCVKISRTRAVA